MHGQANIIFDVSAVETWPLLLLRYYRIEIYKLLVDQKHQVYKYLFI